MRRVYDQHMQHVGWLPEVNRYDRHGDRVAFDRMQRLPGSPSYTFDPKEAARALVRRVAMEVSSLAIDYGRETVLAYVAPHGVGINELRELRGWRDA